jgi:hypothetical protein
MHSVPPPLNALRAFEAAARHLSLTKAALELNVTPGALSTRFVASKIIWASNSLTGACGRSP